MGGLVMRKVLVATCLVAVTAFGADAANANDELNKMSQNPKDWVMPTGDYANTRYSKLNQITAANVGKLQVAWTFSTGVLRGHEGGPLIVGNTMYVHTPFPNKVYALDLSDDVKIFRHQADTTLVALDAKSGKVEWTTKNGDPDKGATGTSAPLVVKDKVLIGISGGEFGVQCHVTAYDLKSGKQVWRAFSEGPDDQIMVDPEKTTVLGKPVGKDSSLKTWQGDHEENGGRL